MAKVDTTLSLLDMEFISVDDFVRLTGMNKDNCYWLVRRIRYVSDVFGINGLVHRVDYLRFLECQLEKGVHDESAAKEFSDTSGKGTLGDTAEKVPENAARAVRPEIRVDVKGLMKNVDTGLTTTEREFFCVDDIIALTGLRTDKCYKLIREIKTVSDVFGISATLHRADYLSFLQKRVDDIACVGRERRLDTNLTTTKQDFFRIDDVKKLTDLSKDASYKVLRMIKSESDVFGISGLIHRADYVGFLQRHYEETLRGGASAGYADPGLTVTNQDFFGVDDIARITGHGKDSSYKLIRKVKTVSDMFGLSGLIHRADWLCFLRRQLDAGVCKEFGTVNK